MVEAGRVDPACQVAELRERMASSALAATASWSACAGSRRMSERSIRSCSDRATSRCWAPSWRSRSSRCRSASPAATIRRRDACSSASRASDSARRDSFSSAMAAAARTASTISGSSSSDESQTLAATARPSRSIVALAGSAVTGGTSTLLPSPTAQRHHAEVAAHLQRPEDLKLHRSLG